MITLPARPSRGARSVARGHVTDAQLSDALDGRLTRDEQIIVDVHVAGCPACAEQRRGLEAVVALGALERVSARSAPDQWAIIEACTVHARRVERFFARRARRRLVVRLLLAAVSGMLLTAGLARVAGTIAQGGAWIAARSRLYTPPLVRRAPAQGGAARPAK